MLIIKFTIAFKVIVGHIYETSIKCLCYVSFDLSEILSVCSLRLSGHDLINRGKIYILKTDFILQTCVNF